MLLRHLKFTLVHIQQLRDIAVAVINPHTNAWICFIAMLLEGER